MLYIHTVNVADLDLNLLRAFDAVLRDGSVTAAAERLGLSQPAMSNALARLRRLLGDPLFMRTASGMRPTPFAQQLAAPVQQALDLIRASFSQQAGFDPGTSDRIFRLQLTDVGEIAFLPPLLERLQRDAPRVRIETQHLPQDEVSDALASGDVDVAVGFLPELSSGVVAQRLFRDRYVCLCAPIIRRSGRASRSPSFSRRPTCWSPRAARRTRSSSRRCAIGGCCGASLCACRISPWCR